MAVALAAVGATAVVRGGSPARDPILLLLVSSCLGTAAGLHFRPHDFVLMQPALAIARAIYGRNPFQESVEVARYIRERTRPDERVAVTGSERQIYFYSGRRSATGYIYTYPLMELQPYATATQRQMIHEVEAVDPR